MSYLKVAIPNKGSLSEQAVQLFSEAGYKTRHDNRQLVVLDEVNQVQFFYLRPRDIAVYVGEGIIDIGITGLDLLLDSNSDAKEIMKLGFAASTFRFATKQTDGKVQYNDVSDLAGKRIATSYSKLVSDYLDSKQIVADSIVKLDGAVESAIDLGVADAIADVVSTGSTLYQAGLRVFGEPLLKSEAVLIKSTRQFQKDSEIEGVFEKLTRRLKGVITAKDYVLIDFDIDSDKVDEIIKFAPGFDSPTISPLTSGASAVRVMVKYSEVNEVMDNLYQHGARAILVTKILASRL